MHVTIEQAEKAIESARKRALELKTQMCIAIVDSGASLKGFYRMNDARVGSIDTAIKKAKTAVFFGMPTGQIGRLSQPGGPPIRHRTFKRRADNVPGRPSNR